MRLGLERAAFYYVVMLAAAYLWLLFTALAYPWATGLLWGLAGAFPGAYSAWRLLASEGETRALIPAQVACLASFVMMAAGAGLGYAFGA